MLRRSMDTRCSMHGSSYKLQLGAVIAELSLNGRNLGDTKYVAFSEPDPGGNAYQPGAGREFFGGLKIQL